MPKRSSRRPVFDDGTDARSDFRRSSRANPRKTLQLCSQIGRALDLALADADVDELLLDVRVQKVVPTADESRLQVIFEADGPAAEAGHDAILVRLEAARPLFVREVAAAISRRKLPELAFEVVRAVDPSGDGAEA